MSAEEPLDDIAGSVSDGGNVDWGAIHGARDPGEKRTIGALREVARIAEFNRELQRSPLPEEQPVALAFETRRWGHLTLLEKVGAGAAGEVWRAWDPKLQRDVALKFLQPADAGAGVGRARSDGCGGGTSERAAACSLVGAGGDDAL